DLPLSDASRASPTVGPASRAGPGRKTLLLSSVPLSSSHLVTFRFRGRVMLSNDRPAPERFLSLIRAQQRGRLKIYLGLADGVGRPAGAREEGHRRQRQGVDVVNRLVDTPGRAETAALIGGLEQGPRRRIEYHGVVLEERDLEAILARRPQVV